MGRNAKASSSKLPAQARKQEKKHSKEPVARGSDSEADSASEDEEIDEDDLLLLDEEAEEEGIAQYAPDDWDGEDDELSASGSESGSGSEVDTGSASESEDESREDMVRHFPPSRLCCSDDLA